MARAKRDQVLRYESTFLSDEDRKSGFVPAAEAKKREGKGKRSLEDMIASMPSDSSQAAYGLERIAAFEDGIAKVLRLCTSGARTIILKERPTLHRYVDDTEGEGDDGQ